MIGLRQGFGPIKWRGEPRRSSKSEGGLASAQFRSDTPQFAAESFISFALRRRELEK